MVGWELVGFWLSKRHKSLQARIESLVVFSTWSPAPTSSSARFRWTPLAMSGDCCSIATSRFKVRQSNPTPFRYYWIYVRSSFILLWWNFHLRIKFGLSSKNLIQLSSLETLRFVVVCTGSIVEMKSNRIVTHPLKNHRSRCAWRCRGRLADNRRWPLTWSHRTEESFRSCRQFLKDDDD